MEQLIESRMKAVEEKEDHKKYLKESGTTDRRTAGKQLENKKKGTARSRCSGTGTRHRCSAFNFSAMPSVVITDSSSQLG